MGGIPRGAFSASLSAGPLLELELSWTTQSAPSTRSRTLPSFAARLLGNLAGNGPAFFSLMVETSLMSKPVSRQDPIAKTA